MPANAAKIIDAAGPDTMTTLVNAFKGLQPGLEQAVGGYYAQKKKEDGQAADGDATKAALQNSVNTWADAVAKDPTLADQSPWYRQIYEARLASSSVQKKTGQVLSDYYNEGIANSTDPAAIGPWLRGKYADTLDQFTSPAAKNAAADELRKVSEQFINSHQKNAAVNLVNQNQDSFSSALGVSLDKWAATDGSDTKALAATWQSLEAGAKSQGVDGRTINTIMAKSLSTGMIRLGRSDISQIGTAPRPDGTPGFATTEAGRAALVGAQDHMNARSTQLESQLWTREQRIRATSDRDAEGSLMSLLVSRAGAGQDPRLTTDELAQYGRTNPEVVTKALAAQNAMRAYTQQEDPKASAIVMTKFYSGEGTINDVLDMATSGKFSPETLKAASSLARENAQDDGLKASGVTTMVTETANIVGQVAPITGIMAEPIMGAQAANMMREEAMAFRKANPSATAADQLANLRKKQPDIIAALRPSFDLSSMDAKARPRNMANEITGQANAQGVDPRVALATASIESSMGTRPDTPGNDHTGVFQMGTPEWAARGGTAGNRGDVYKQVELGVGNLAVAQRQVTQATGKPAEGWQTYMVHQQGSGGGPALLTADPKVNVVDALTPAYGGDAVKARAAIVSNGGTPNMTVGAFLGTWQDRYAAADKAAGGSKVQSTAPTAPPPTPPTPAQVKATDERNAVTYTPRPGIEWRNTPTFPSLANLNDAIHQEVKGGGSPVLRMWFKELNLNTAADQQAFVKQQRLLLQ